MDETQHSAPAGETETNDPYPNAGRASGYIGEDLVNKVTIIVSQTQTTVLQVRSELKTDIQAARNDVAGVARQYVELREHWEVRFDYMLGHIKSFTDRADRQLTVYGEQIDNLSRRMDVSERDRAELRTMIERLPASEQLKVVKDIKDELHRIAVRQWLQFIPIALVVFMLFVWAVITLARLAP